MPFASHAAAWRQWSKSDIKRFKVAMYHRATAEGLEYEAFVANANLIPTGFVKMAKQPSYPSDSDPREGTKGAMKHLEAAHPERVKQAAAIAVAQAKKNLTTHSRSVRKEMEDKGLLDTSTGSEHWLGAVFAQLAHAKVLEKSGHTFKYSDSSRGIHERTVTVWQLRDGADTSAYENAE